MVVALTPVTAACVTKVAADEQPSLVRVNGKGGVHLTKALSVHALPEAVVSSAAVTFSIDGMKDPDGPPPSQNRLLLIKREEGLDTSRKYAEVCSTVS